MARAWTWRLIGPILLSLTLTRGLPAAGPAGKAAAIDFDRQIAPLLVQRCLDCHGGPKPKGRLDLSGRRPALDGGKSGPVLLPGNPDESRLIEYVEADRMPPKKPLAASEKKLLRAWVAGGAAWGSESIDPFRFTTARRASYDWWALQPVRRPTMPAVRDAAWVRNPVDAFVLSRLEARGLHAAPEADRRTLIRRLSFDLLGLPPSPEEVDAFVRDASPAAYARLVDRFLASPQYGVRWARHWLDVVRFGESNGFEFDEFRPNAWPYRDWVVDALNADLPYDAFARLQLVGDVLRPDDPGAIRATGFLVAGAYDTVGQTQQSEAMRRVVRQDELEDLVGIVGQTFLGLTVHCARCHDHKFDPVRQADYYRLTAALGGVRHGDRTLPLPPAQAADARWRLVRLEAERAVLEAPARARILAERRALQARAPVPLAAWDFADDGRDQRGDLHATLQPGARLVRAGLKVDGDPTSYARTVPLARDLKAKTLEAWVTLKDLARQGGAAVSVQTLDGHTFDALVFGEREPGRWMAGSEEFRRTQSFHGPAETEAAGRPVHVALTYAEDGAITAYRDGRVYGSSYKAPGAVTFKAGRAEVLFGLRHTPAGGNRLLAGIIHRARLYDRALTPAEVAESAAIDTAITPEAIAARLSPEQQARQRQLRAGIREVRALLAGADRPVYAVTPRQPEVARVLVRGNPQQPAEVVSAGGVAALPGPSADFGMAPDAPEAERRRRLAAWVADRRNPLFARVIVNRLWHYHFGVGLVETPNDLGFNGGRPSHPDLLDWLAAELTERGFSLKAMHRVIVLSATYRQSGRWSEAAARVDAGDRLLWRKAPLRLEAEMVRDAILRVSGRLNPRMGGPSYQDFNVRNAPGTPANLYTPADPSGWEFDRRTLYRAWARAGRSRLLDVLDCPEPAATAPSRAVTTTPLQALALLNNALVLREAEQFAGRLARDAGPDVDAQVRRAYLLALGRPPDGDELARDRAVVQRHGLTVLARALFNSSEFLFVD
jgi:hypothetical protein